MQIENLYIGKKLYCIKELTIYEVTITGIIDKENDKLEIHIQAQKGANKLLIYYFLNTQSFSDGYTMNKETLIDYQKSKIVKNIQDLENQIKNLRLKNWDLLCK